MSSIPLPPLTREQADITERELHEGRLLALTVPRRYGGVGADPVACAHALRELGKNCSATALEFQ